MTKNDATKIFGIFIVVVIITAQDVAKEQEQAVQVAKEQEQVAQVAKEQAEKIALIKKQNIDYFHTNKEKIIASLKTSLSSKDYQSVVSSSSKYLAIGDAELNKLHLEAKEIIEKQKKIKLAAEARAKKIKSQFSLWDGSHYQLEKLIKRGMNDPNSYEHVETVYWDQNTYIVVQTTFRGRNAFGGMVRNFVKAKVSLVDGQILQILDQT